jgi:tRNA dimethylallyltransferase
MIDIRYPDEDFTAGDYVREARGCINEISRKGKLPIVVGGTGLYIRLMLGGIIDLPPGDPELKRRLRNEATGSDTESLFRRLGEVDPALAGTIPPRNRRRITRALEVFEMTGMRLSRLQAEHSFKDRPFASLFLCLVPNRKLLYERIDKRVDSMIENGLVEEVQNLYRRGYPPCLKPLQSLGYRHVGMVLAGETDTREAIRLMKRDTRRYAKRQLTWFRSEPEVFWCDPADRQGIRFIVEDFLGRSS